MPSNTTHDESGDGTPRWAATAGRESILKLLLAKGVQLLRPAGRPRTHSGTDPNTRGIEVSWHVRQRVLRDYHAANLLKARAASEELVRAGFNTGDVPYGYRAHRVRVTPPGRRPRWRTRLTIDPVEASTVQTIFRWRGRDRLPLTQIRQRLTASRYPAPLDPDTGQPGVWTVAIVRAILRNPKYLGRQVWGRTHHGKRAPRTEWAWSTAWVHPPLVTAEAFAVANPHPGRAVTLASDIDATASPTQRRAA